jgi:hypothetical protein
MCLQETGQACDCDGDKRNHPKGLLGALDLTSEQHLLNNTDSETGRGENPFSRQMCDGCETDLAGARYDYVIARDNREITSALVDELARSLWAHSWARHAEECLCTRTSGKEITEIMPQSCAYTLKHAREILSDSGFKLTPLLRDYPNAESAAHDICALLLGHGGGEFKYGDHDAMRKVLPRKDELDCEIAEEFAPHCKACLERLDDVATTLLGEVEGIDHCDDGGCEHDDCASLDVRIQIRENADHDYYVRVGSSDYDQDHRGYWGASSIGLHDDLESCRRTAAELIDQALEMANQ